MTLTHHDNIIMMEMIFQHICSNSTYVFATSLHMYTVHKCIAIKDDYTVCVSPVIG